MYEIIILLLLNIKECRVMSYNPIYSFLKTQYIVKCYTERAVDKHPKIWYNKTGKGKRL